MEGEYFTTSDYNTFTTDILDANIKLKAFRNKFDISNLLKK